MWKRDGSHVTSHGRRSVNCQKYDLDMSSPVTRVVFEGSGLVDTFELFTDKKCSERNRTYRENQGSYTLRPARKILSYKVY